MNKIIFSVVILCLAATYASSNADEEINDIGDQTVLNYINMVLANLQGIIAKKDPINMGDYYQQWNDTEEITGATADIYNMVWTGLGGFTINGVTFDLESLTAAIAISIPQMDVTGGYDAQGTVSGTQATASGNFDVSMTAALLNGTIVITPDVENNTVEVSVAFEFTIQSMEVVMSNLQGSTELEAQLQQNAIDLYNQIYSRIQNKISSIGKPVSDIINSMLVGINDSDEPKLDIQLLMWKLNKLSIEFGFL